MLQAINDLVPIMDCRRTYRLSPKTEAPLESIRLAISKIESSGGNLRAGFDLWYRPRPTIANIHTDIVAVTDRTFAPTLRIDTKPSSHDADPSHRRKWLHCLSYSRYATQTGPFCCDHRPLTGKGRADQDILSGGLKGESGFCDCAGCFCA